MLDTLFGEGQSGLKILFFVIVVLVLLALAFWLLRRFGAGRLGGGAARGRQPRLARLRSIGARALSSDDCCCVMIGVESASFALS